MEAESTTLYTPFFLYVSVPAPQKPQRGRTEADLGTAILFSNDLWDCFSSPAQRCLEELSHHEFESCFSLLLWASGFYMTFLLSHSSWSKQSVGCGSLFSPWALALLHLSKSLQKGAKRQTITTCFPWYSKVCIGQEKRLVRSGHFIQVKIN